MLCLQGRRNMFFLSQFAATSVQALQRISGGSCRTVGCSCQKNDGITLKHSRQYFGLMNIFLQGVQLIPSVLSRWAHMAPRCNASPTAMPVFHSTLLTFHFSLCCGTCCRKSSNHGHQSPPVNRGDAQYRQACSCVAIWGGGWLLSSRGCLFF